MKTLFLAFANNRESPLTTLKEEDETVYRWLVRRAAKNHFNIHRDSYCDLKKISEYLILLRDDIEVFLFSGHAERDQLLLEDESVQSSGIADLLSQCPNLKLVILNGCSTEPQVNELLNKGVPAVIATHAPVEDKSATQFSIHFFQSLCEQYVTLEEAFQIGIGAVKLSSSNIEVTRGLGRRNNSVAEEKPLWGLFHKEENSDILNWKLPSESTPIHSDFETNELLIDSLIETLADYNKAISKIHEDESLGIERSQLDKRKEILESMPYPISEHLRKLMVPQDSGSDLVFYDKVGAARLNQLVVTYKTIIELLESIMLAQLWDALSANKNLSLNEEEKIIVKNYLLQPNNQVDNEFPPLIRTIRIFFVRNEISFFMDELTDVAKEFEEQSHFYNACIFMEMMDNKREQNNSLSGNEVHQLCKIAEEKLAAIFKPLGFIVNYMLSSIKDIEVIKYRHLETPRFKHQVVKLVQRFVGLAEEPQVMTEYTDSASVLLLKTSEESTANQFLNLSPFIIDENAFDSKATGISKLYLFNGYVKMIDAFNFKHIYKPEDRQLNIKKQKHFIVLKAQFDAFAKLAFGNPFDLI